MTLGVVLSGGGARGAYEAGVLSFVFDRLADELDVAPIGVLAAGDGGDDAELSVRTGRAQLHGRRDR